MSGPLRVPNMCLLVALARNSYKLKYIGAVVAFCPGVAVLAAIWTLRIHKIIQRSK